MKLEIQIGQLAEYIEEFLDTVLVNDQEVDIRSLGCMVNTPTNPALINYIIKKENLTGLKISLESGVEIKCAKKHILRKDNCDIFADALAVGESIETINGNVKIVQIEQINDTTFYDIGIDAPYLYYDSDGVLHHNTLMTAALSDNVEPYGRSIVIVPNKSLVTQTEADYRNLGLDVGVFYGKRKEYTKTHTICTWQSLNNLGKRSKDGEAPIPMDEFLDGVVCVIVDEVHQAKAEVLKQLLSGPMADIPLRWGLTGTVPKEDFEFASIKACIGEVIHQVRASELQNKGVLADCQVNVLQTQDHQEFANYQQELKYLVTDSDRLKWMAERVEDMRADGNVLVLVDRITTGQELEQLIPNSVFVSGGTKDNDRVDHYTSIQTAQDKVIIATYGVAAVGINIPRIFNLMLVEPGKSFVRVIQSIGRGIRKAHDKDFVQIWDVTSSCKFSKRHLAKRKAYYRDANYPFTVKKIII